MTIKLELSKFITKIDYETEQITLIEEWQGRVFQYLYNLKEQCLIDALIELGWTPPTKREKFMDGDYCHE